MTLRLRTWRLVELAALLLVTAAGFKLTLRLHHIVIGLVLTAFAVVLGLLIITVFERRAKARGKRDAPPPQ
jgi:multisubunit Na+/H+ antiporter MnhC subunit